MRPRAASLLQSLATEAGFAGWSELRDAWYAVPGTTLELAPPTPRHVLEIWRRILALSEWQLRGVDDGRFVLSREGRAAAECLGRALRDEDRYIRTHAAQCLERMGRRGAIAGPQLVEALDDPEIAYQAAEALGGVHYEPATGALIERLSPKGPLELRVAAARALGQLEGEAIAPALRPLLDEGEALDLRAAAASSLARTAALDDTRDAVALLVELLESPALEPTATELALDDWLARREQAGLEGAAALHEAWRAIDDEDDRERARKRADLLR
jgi:HEAT repeat protein